MLFIVDNAGRKKPLIYGAPSLAMLFIIFGVLNSQMKPATGAHGDDRVVSSCGIAVMFLFNLVFNLSFGPMGWTYLAEVLVRPLPFPTLLCCVALPAIYWVANAKVSH